MPYIGKKPADIIATAVDTTTGDFSGNVTVSGAFTSQGIDDNADATAITIDSGESVFIGNTAEFVDGTGTGDKGIQLNPLGLTVSTRNGGVSGIFGRQASDGDILQFRKDGSAVGTLGANGGRPYIAGPSKGIKFGNGSANPVTNTGAASDNGYDLGSTNVRWKDLYLAGGLFVGGTGSTNELDDYEEGGFTPGLQGYSGTATFTDGMYKKIGHMAFVSFGVTLDNTSDGSHFVVTSLPFVSANTSQMGGYINYTDSTKTDRIHVLKTAADQRVALYEVGGGTLTYNEIRNSASSVDVRITVIYHTN